MDRIAAARTRAVLAAAVLAAASAWPPAARAVEQLDWCAPIAVRPDARFYTQAPACEPWWPDDEIARRADLVFDGFLHPSISPVAPDASNCWGPETMASSGAYHARLRALAAGYGRSLVFVYASRLDLVDRATAGTPGLRPEFLVDTDSSWRSVTDFFVRDRTPTCGCGCEWSDDASALGQAPGQRLRDLIDAVGAPGSYATKVFYGIRPSSGGSAAGAPRRFFGSSAIADQSNADYRAWRIEHLRDAIETGDYDYVSLNEKFSQYLPGRPEEWFGGDAIPDVAAYVGTADGGWTAQPRSYGYLQYLAGWIAFADDLEAAGIPFSVTLTPFPWAADTLYDDASTPDVDEAELVKAVARRTPLVLLTRAAQFDDAEHAAIVADIESAGTAHVVTIDPRCGYGSPPGRPPVPLAASLSLAPDNAATGHYAATTLRVGASGAATGPWDADLWCHCPTLPCGTPSASTVGQIGTSWEPPLGVCDAAYQSPAGSRRARVEVRRAGYVATSSRALTLCQPTCANGRDDDRDGHADFPADLGCASAGDLDETDAAVQCDDNADNDGDDRIDVGGDPQCKVRTDRETGRSGCGLGAEAALALAILRRRRT
jgi:hypothetical protein